MPLTGDWLESSIFVLALTPDAVGSTWVHSETNVAIGLQHQEALRFIPLDVKPAAVPPLWQAYQWIPFQNDDKAGLEALLRELQPEKMRQLDGLYRQLQAAAGCREWARVQKLGAEITAQYPDYRETETLTSLAEREEAREQRQQAEARAKRQQADAHAQRQQMEAAQLYSRLQAAIDAADWAAALTLVGQIEALVPGYRDVQQLAIRARRGQRQNRRDNASQILRRIPVWGWGGGVIVVAFALFLFFQWDGSGSGRSTATPKPTLSIVGQITPEIPTASAAPRTTGTRQPTNTETPSPTHTPTPELTNTPTTAPTPAPDIGSTRIRPVNEAVMVYVPAGEFMMGSDDGNSDEQPVHEVYLDSYWIDQTEVTNAQFAQFVAATGYETTAEQEGTGYAYADGSWGWVGGADWQHPSGLDSSLDGLDEHPVVQVSWDDAAAYCEWSGGRLPTEAEWEKVAAWDDNVQKAYAYPWGNDFDGTRLNFCDSNCPFDHKDDSVNDGYGDTAPVGSYLDGVSSYGALDMAGNVWEWTADWFDSEYYRNSPDQNPQGPDNGDYKVLRGGSWSDYDGNVRAADRSSNGPANRSNFVGFRCAQE